MDLCYQRWPPAVDCNPGTGYVKQSPPPTYAGPIYWLRQSTRQFATERVIQFYYVIPKPRTAHLKAMREFSKMLNELILVAVRQKNNKKTRAVASFSSGVSKNLCLELKQPFLLLVPEVRSPASCGFHTEAIHVTTTLLQFKEPDLLCRSRNLVSTKAKKKWIHRHFF